MKIEETNQVKFEKQKESNVTRDMKKLQLTIRGKLFPSKEHSRKVDYLMHAQSSCMRYSYSRLCEDESKSEIEKDSQEKFYSLNSRYLGGGYFRAEANYKSAKELVKTGELEDESKVVFGGRKNLKRRERGEITNKEWKQLRNNHLYCRGDKSKGGNLNLRFVKKNGELKLRVNIGNRRWIYIPAYVAAEEERLLEGKEAYSVRIIRKNGEYELRVGFEEEHPVEIEFEKGAVGLDFNQPTIDLAIINEQGQLKETKTIGCHDLTCASKNKREWLIGNFAKKVVDYAKYWKRGLVIEKLENVARNKSNQHKFVHRKFLEAVKRRAVKEGIAIREVNPAYTSIIGKWKYSRYYNISVHQASALVIARRGKGFHEQLHGLKKLAFEVMEAGKGEKNVDKSRLHSWSLWSLIGNLPFPKGTKHRNSDQAHLLSEMESLRTSASTERCSGGETSPEGKIAIPGSGPPQA